MLNSIPPIITFYKPFEKETIEFVVYENPTSAPPQINPHLLNAKPKPQNQPKSRGVFGLSRKTLNTEEPNAIAVKAGNTTAKTPDQKVLKATDEDTLPIPTDELLVSQMPELNEEVRIPYPPDAKKKGIQGAVVMEILIDEKGNVRQATFLQGPGGGLDEAALDAVKKFHFRPALIQEKPVAVKIRYAYRFVLE